MCVLLLSQALHVHNRCVLSGGLLACLERERMDLYFSELIAESKFTLTMLPVSWVFHINTTLMF